MREFFWAIINSAFAIVLAAATIIFGSKLGVWRIVLWVAVSVFLLAAIGLFIWERRNKRHIKPNSNIAPPPLKYLNNRVTELEFAIRKMAWRSAWGRWYSAQYLNNHGSSIREDSLLRVAGDLVLHKIIDGDLEVRGRKPGESGYETIPGTDWRSSMFYFIADDMALWKMKIIPRADTTIIPPDTFISHDDAATNRNSKICGYDDLIVDAYQFEALWPHRDELSDRRTRKLLRTARRRRFDQAEIERLSC